jgi:hypothetical protein
MKNDDLISRKAALEAIEVIATSRSKYIETLEERYIKMVKEWVSEIIADLPPVPAVPLDKLCEWLASIPMMNCRVCKETVGFCDGKTNNICGSAEQWKAILTKWMEGLDAEVH